METIKELEMNELEQVTGGYSLCAFIGAADGGEVAACANYGAGTNDVNAGIGFTLCIYAGIGLGFTGKDSKKN